MTTNKATLEFLIPAAASPSARRGTETFSSRPTDDFASYSAAFSTVSTLFPSLPTWSTRVLWLWWLRNYCFPRTPRELWKKKFSQHQVTSLKILWKSYVQTRTMSCYCCRWKAISIEKLDKEKRQLNVFL